MIPTKTDAVVDSTLVGERVPMVLDEESTPFIMEVLTKMYSDEETACIREYSTNAWDSHIFAGNTGRPIEVTTPTLLSPFLMVKDFGVGMNADDIRNTYSRYGKSNKRTDNRTNGNMGIGSKVGLALASQFTVIGVKDGVSTTVAVSLDEEGIGQQDIVEVTATDAPNGVTIMVPSDAVYSMDRKARYFFQFWKKGTVLLNGADPTREFNMVTDHLSVWEGDEDVIVMGNVPYPVSDQYQISVGTRRSVVAFVDMDSPEHRVKNAPSREGLVYNAVTKNALETLRNEFSEHIGEYVKSALAASKNHTEAINTYFELRADFGHAATNGLSYGKIDFDDFSDDPKYLPDGQSYKTYYPFVAYYPARSRNAVNGNRSLSIRNIIGSSLIVTGYKSTSIPSPYRARIKDWARANGANVGYNTQISLMTDEVYNEFAHMFEGCLTVTWEKLIADTKPAPKPRTPRNSIGSENYEYYTKPDDQYSVRKHNVGPVSAEDHVIYLSPRWDFPHSYFEPVFKKYPDVKIVVTPVNRHNKLAKFVKNAEKWDSNKWHRIIATDAYNAISDEDRRKIMMYGVVRENFGYYGIREMPPRHVALDTIDDPRYTQMKVWQDAYNSCPEHDYRAQNDPRWDVERKKVEKEFKDLKFKRVSSDYPLVNWSHPKHSVAYINAVYAETTGKDN